MSAGLVLACVSAVIAVAGVFLTGYGLGHSAGRRAGQREAWEEIKRRDTEIYRLREGQGGAR